MIIAHYKKTKLAMAPDAISEAINRHTKHESFVTDVIEELKSADFVHYHNQFFDAGKPCLIQYHSEPINPFLNIDAPVKKRLTLLQYHCTLPEYADCIPMRNVINFDTEVFENADQASDTKIRIGYYPSTYRKNNEYFDKGYEETMPILERLSKELDIEIDVPGKMIDHSECLERKKKCHIIIDEVKTGSYHRSTLEGMALGKLVVVNISETLGNKLYQYDHILPIWNCTLDNLEESLSFWIELLGSQETNIQQWKIEGKSAKLYMEKFWNPKDVVQDYIKQYEEVLKGW